MPTVGVIGSGIMGAGIAQIAAAHGYEVRLMDVDQSLANKAIEGIAKRFDRQVEKGRMTPAEAGQSKGRLQAVTEPSAMADCKLIVEAVVENLETKVKVFNALLPEVASSCILASNTSSLSITQMGQAIGEEARFVGMHFFNPVPLLPLVEIVSGNGTSQESADRVATIAKSWGKTVVRCKDTPGFIVNRVARGYYLESLRILSDGIAGIDEIDSIMKRLGGFRMGPFELMDLVGIDVNYTVSCSVYEQMDKPARLEPHSLQAKLFDKQHFGRKTGQGFYSYDTDTPLPAVDVDRKSFEFPDALKDATLAFCSRASEETGSATEQYVFARVLSTVINEAALAFDDGIASSDDIDTAMRTGTNYPKGPLEWADKIGHGVCSGLLESLNEGTMNGRFAPAAFLAKHEPQIKT